MSCEECTVSCVQYNLILDAERLCMDAERLCIVYNDVRTANDVGSIRDRARMRPEFSRYGT